MKSGARARRRFRALCDGMVRVVVIVARIRRAVRGITVDQGRPVEWRVRRRWWGREARVSRPR